MISFVFLMVASYLKLFKDKDFESSDIAFVGFVSVVEFVIEIILCI